MAKLDPKTIKEERRALVSAQYENGLFLDRWLLTLSAGVFSLTIVFWKDIIGQRSPQLPGLLIASWIAFCACIITVLVSYLLGYPAYSRQIDILESDREDCNIFRALMNVLNVLSVLLFSTAVILLAIFAASNLMS